MHWSYRASSLQGSVQSGHPGVQRPFLSDTMGKGPPFKHEVAPWQPGGSVCPLEVGRVWADFVPDIGMAPFVISRTCLGGQVGHSTIKKETFPVHCPGTREPQNYATRPWGRGSIVLTRPQGGFDTLFSAGTLPQGVTHEARTLADRSFSANWPPSPLTTGTAQSTSPSLTLTPHCFLLLPFTSSPFFPSQPFHRKLWNPNTC